MKNRRNEPEDQSMDISRRSFLASSAGAGALLALSPQAMVGELSDRGPRQQTFFFNLSHEDFAGHDYVIYIAGQGHVLQEVSSISGSLPELRTNSFLAALPPSQITHVVQKAIVPSTQVLLSYIVKDRNKVTKQWQMSQVLLIPPLSGLTYAYGRARALAGDAEFLPMSAKRALYGLDPARSLKDMQEEYSLLDSNDWGAALVNLHPELLSADGDSAAHVQFNYINTSFSLPALARHLRKLGPAMPQTGDAGNSQGWATLVPYMDEGQTLYNTKASSPNYGLILYGTEWNADLKDDNDLSLKDNINAVTADALPRVKNDTTLGVNIANAVAQRGTMWSRTDGVASVDQSQVPESSSGIQFNLKNITPDFAGYSCSLLATGNQVTLTASNWFLRYLGFWLQFLDGDGKPLMASSLDSNITKSGVYTNNQEILIDGISPESTLYGIPIQQAMLTFAFDFPPAAVSARVIASGLGVGSHLAPDTELYGIVMTSLFNLFFPTALLALGLGTTIDLFVKAVAIPTALATAKAFVGLYTGATAKEIVKIFAVAFATSLDKKFPALFAKLSEFLGAATPSRFWKIPSPLLARSFRPSE